MRPLNRLFPSFLLALFLAASLPATSRAAGLPVHGYALLVGVNTYEKSQLNDLLYPENDMNALAEVLRAAGYHRVVVLTKTQALRQARYLPTAANVRRELRGLLEDRREGDTVVVAFSGHGVEFTGSDEPYFCPMDARLGERDTLISLGEVYRQLGKCKARARVLFSDACRNDPLAKVTRSALGAQVFAPRSEKGRKPPENVVALFACSPGEAAHESARLKHGVFFYHVIQGLKGKAALPGARGITLGGLADHVQRGVADFVREEFGPGDHQRPELVGRYSGTLTLVPLRKAPARPAWEAEVSRLVHRADYARAENRLGAVIVARDADEALALAIRAEVRVRRGRAREGLADARRAAELEPALARAHFSQGFAHARLRQHDEAVRCYTAALDLRPDYPSALNNRGNVHYAKGNYALAVADYTQAIRLDRQYALAWYNRGSAYLEMKKYAEAVDDLGESLRLAPASPDALEARGRAHLGREDHRKAEADFTAALAKTPDNPELYELRAQARGRLGKKEQAEADRLQARQLRTKEGQPGGPGR